MSSPRISARGPKPKRSAPACKADQDSRPPRPPVPRATRAGRRCEHLRDLCHLFVIALKIEDHADGGRVTHERAVALVGLDHEQVRLSCPRIAGQALSRQFGADHPPVIAEGSRPCHSGWRRSSPSPSICRWFRSPRSSDRQGDEMREQLRAIDDGNVQARGPRRRQALGFRRPLRRRARRRGGTEPAPILR